MKKYALAFLVFLMIGTGSLIWVYTNTVTTSQAAETSTVDMERLGSGSGDSATPSLPDVVEFKSDDTSLKVHLNDIPQYKKYLLNEGNIESVIARTQFVKLPVATAETYAMLKYSCGTQACSTILIRTDGEHTESLTMPVGIFQDYKLSPDHDKMLFRYASDEGGVVVRHIIVAVDLDSFKVIRYASPDLEKQFLLKPTWPVLSYAWINNHRFDLETAALDTSDFNAIKDWLSSERRKIKKVEIKLDDNHQLDEFPRE